MEVRIGAPERLGKEAESFGPHLLVCNDGAAEVPTNVRFYVEILYTGSMSARQRGRETEVEDISTDDLLALIDEVEKASLRGWPSDYAGRIYPTDSCWVLAALFRYVLYGDPAPGESLPGGFLQHLPLHAHHYTRGGPPFCILSTHTSFFFQMLSNVRRRRTIFGNERETYTFWSMPFLKPSL